MNMTFDQERQHLLKRLNHLIDCSDQMYEDFILHLFHFQYKYNKVYASFVNNLEVKAKEIALGSDIPFLPISAFKHHQVKTGDFTAFEVFKSSGTMSTELRSEHHVREVDLYLSHTIQIWNHYFNPVNTWCFLALLPGYTERGHSSLIKMVGNFISKSPYEESGFYLNNHRELMDTLQRCKQKSIPTVLFGVTYALLDFINKYSIDFPDLMVMETGGMKGLKEELTKIELHQLLAGGFNVQHIYSEYGMTELLSQVYAANQVFKTNPFFKVDIKQMNDPLQAEKTGKPGIVCITDAANIDSCCFIQTEDVGILHASEQFELIGRLDAAELRGCNLLMVDII
ncbi:MAG: acyl transferase [Saprospiraceae bacterium]|nr:acyl transferase [Saprospiraceae bacterium]